MNESLTIHRSSEIPALNMEALLNKAIDAKSAVEVMERLQVMRREIRAEQSKEAFDAAMADFQSECPVIQKKKMGAKNAYKYAPLDDIVTQVRDIIRKNGFSFTITSEIEPNWVKAICKITHCSGHSEISEFKVPIDSKNPMMSDPQRYGGSMTFSKRYAFCNGFGILTADEDIDGVASRPKPAGPAKATEKTLLEWFLPKMADIKDKLFQYGIDKAIIMPDEPLEKWPLDKVPTSKQEFDILRMLVEAHK